MRRCRCARGGGGAKIGVSTLDAETFDWGVDHSYVSTAFLMTSTAAGSVPGPCRNLQFRPRTCSLV
jgi:hypothetical protein